MLSLDPASNATVLSSEQPGKHCPLMTSKLDGRQMYGREAQLQNAFSPSTLSLDPASNVTELSFLQPEKQWSPMISKLDGRQMDVREAHIRKALSPSTLSFESASNATVPSFLQPAKQHASSRSMKDGIQTTDSKQQESKPPRLFSLLPGSNVIYSIFVPLKQPSMSLSTLDRIQINGRGHA
jgi:hypothetical protein